MGVIVLNKKTTGNKKRQEQIKVFLKGYNDACDSLNKFGLHQYKDVIRKRYKISEQALKALPDSMKFPYAVSPRQKDIERAQAWLKKK